MGEALTIERVERLHWLLLAATVALAFLAGGLTPVSVAAGGVFMGVNVNLMKHLLRRVLNPAGPRRVGPAIALLLAKSALFLGLILLLFRRIPIDGLSFAVGATVFLAASVIAAALAGGTSQGEL